MTRLRFGAERNARRNAAEHCVIEVDGVVACLFVQQHATNRYFERFFCHSAYAQAEAERMIKRSFTKNIDLFDAVVTTKESSFAIYDEHSNAVYLGQLWLDQVVPNIFVSSVWAGRPFRADRNDKQIVVTKDDTVMFCDIYAYMCQHQR